MTQEEKAKAYDDAIERARIWKDKSGMPKDKQGILDDIFPELKESEDERIRKAIIGYIDHGQHYGVSNKEMLAWLEKQGEKPQGKTALEAIKEEKVDNANKVEPKFKVGDWVVQGCNILKIRCVSDEYYRFETVEGYVNDMFISEIDSLYHLWTIKDAKDGDVLCYKYEISIYKHDIQNCTKQEETFGGFVYHCCYDGKIFITNSLYSLTEQDKKDIHPATKEQRDTLMKAMANVGYFFDFERKELKKIEQKHVDEPSAFKDKLLELFQKFRYIKEGMPTNGDIIDYVDAHIQELIDIIQNKPWGEEDERMLIDALDMVEWYIGRKESKCRSVSDWLKSLKDRMLPQNIAYYNPYKEVVESIAEMCKHYDKASHSGLRDFYDNVKVKCKDAKEYDSLFPQNTWKPSDEQIEAIKLARSFVTDDFDDSPTLSEILTQLETQLKKLKEK